jgi:gamma-glutamyltranspeptidase/glutathione hydrolase
MAMRRGWPLYLAAALLPAPPLWAQAPPPEPMVVRSEPHAALGHRDMVAAAHPLAAAAGREVLRRGGNAIDAAIATQLVLNLVEPQSSGIGGGAFLVYWSAAEGQVVSFDGRETAPAAARPDRFLDASGKPLAFYDAVVGGRSVGTPGVLRVLELAHRRYGRLAWAALFAPAIELAETGLPSRRGSRRCCSATRFCARASRRAAISTPPTARRSSDSRTRSLPRRCAPSRRAAPTPSTAARSPPTSSPRSGAPTGMPATLPRAISRNTRPRSARRSAAAIAAAGSAAWARPAPAR